ncbi:MAG: UDP-N-acetylglucosamine--N-acetylmuramyl-(pentapeptide) pyrophosphoryl-undecaprenol N-acetylglucosamine transferase [Candidatus Microgenomates bacterium]|jgi:UDP-N-acetylglucosamine--N-acetylmuramyl-(pentapeptide) pyrophosphoryl-undecaprenol N-acetylglucosamine transferase
MLRTRENRLILTGGHAATTAIAVVEQIKSEGKDWKLYWIGVKNAIEGKKVVTLESEALPRLGVRFLPLITGRLQRRFTLWTVPSLLKIPVGFIQSFYYLLKIKPKAILSFGGFASFPVVFNANLLGIPVVIHEQTSRAGRANLLSAKFASVIAISRKESEKYFPGKKLVITGNPVMKEIIRVKPKSKPGDPPTIFVTGGSRGSQSINDAIEKILRVILSKYRVIHQTGGLDYLKFSEIKQKLPQALRNNYEVFVRVNPLEVYKIYSRCDLVVARAGANTVSEIMAVKRPAILIPLPISFKDEQTGNASIATDWGIAEIIPQSKLSSNLLLREIERMISKYSSIIGVVRFKKSPDLDASKNLLRLIDEYFK